MRTLEVGQSRTEKRATDDPEARWHALIHRDPAADGRFVYAVATTGVFCRPSCASRRPLRKNVEFFISCEAATRAGYRPCKRCRPNELQHPSRVVQAIIRACRTLEGEGPARTDGLAEQVGVTTSYFVRAFKKHTGVTPQAYRRRVLAERARGELGRSGSVTRALYAAGYSSSSRFYAGVGRELGMAPREARAGAQGKAVTYVIRACSLGELLVAWTERGACEVSFGDSRTELVRSLVARYPGAMCKRAQPPAWIVGVLDAVEHPRPIDVPLDIRGTAFQQRVWAALRRIPPGETRTYTQVARAIGAPESVRAVANACASNRLGVVVPCHRVVRADGDVSGYRWGRERKQELLRREAKQR
jgi:AraC family transcriptional regulator of adaptative response/methylated-DNA-[protein]-cysteine methyltransferase